MKQPMMTNHEPSHGICCTFTKVPTLWVCRASTMEVLAAEIVSFPMKHGDFP